MWSWKRWVRCSLGCDFRENEVLADAAADAADDVGGCGSDGAAVGDGYVRQF